MLVAETAQLIIAEPRPVSHASSELKLSNFQAAIVQGFFSPARKQNSPTNSPTLRLSVQMRGTIIIYVRYCETLQQSGESTRILHKNVLEHLGIWSEFSTR